MRFIADVTGRGRAAEIMRYVLWMNGEVIIVRESSNLTCPGEMYKCVDME